MWLRLCCLLCIGLAHPAAVAADWPDLVERIKPSVVGVGTAYPPRQPIIRGERANYLGTGFVVDDGLTVVTNAHVLPEKLDTENRQLLAVFVGKGADTRVRPARIVRRDDEHDLALLKIRGEPLPALTLGDSDAVREGAAIAFTGFPLGMALGLFPVTHRGYVAAITPMAHPADRAGELTSLHLHRTRRGAMAFQLDATAYPGNSGSPVFGPDGLVVGVLNSVVVKETRETMLANPSGISYAVPSRHIVNLLAGPASP